jgi:hypothetical protein
MKPERRYTYEARGRTLNRYDGTELSIRHERGRFRFHYYDTDTDTITVYGGSPPKYRTFHANQIRVIHRKRKLR